MLSKTIRFFSNNVNRIQSFKGRVKFFEYLKNPITSIGFIFLQKIEKKMERRV